MGRNDRLADEEGVAERWRFEPGDRVRSSPAVVDGIVYVVSGGGLHALDAATGDRRWAFEAGVGTSPAVGDGTVYAGSADGTVYAVDATNGMERWRFDTGGQVKSPPAVGDGTVYVGSNDDESVYALDAATGNEQWCFETGGWLLEDGGWVPFSPAVGDGTVYVGCDNGTLYALDTATGAQRWTFETGNRVSSPVVADGTVYVVSDCLYAVDTEGGTERWRFEGGGLQLQSLATGDGTVYVGSEDGTLYALDASSDGRRWTFDAGKVSRAPAVGDGTVYVGSEDGTLHAVDVDGGTERWRFDTGGRIVSSPAVADGTVYVGNDDGHLYAVAAEDTVRTTALPEPGELVVGRVDEIEDFGVFVDLEEYVDKRGLVHVSEVASGWIKNVRDHVGVDERVVCKVLEVDEDAQQIDLSIKDVDEQVRSELLQGRAAGDDSDEGGARPSVETADGIADTGGGVPEPEAVASPPRRDLSYEDLEPVSEVGVGGQAVIRKARLTEAKRPPEFVALREPDTSATLTREAVEEFRSQAETWATIDAREREKQRWEGYEHVVGIIATGDRQPWLAMEFMDGGDLGELLAEHPDGLPVARALWYGECVCRGLEIAHNLGRVHLDVKPGNVLLKGTEGWPWPKLADWGLARTLADETGTMEGLSVEYAGPEQFDSSEFGDPDQLTDIYQTGALVYALLTGTAPASGSQFEVMQRVMSDEPVTPPSERRPDLPAAVDAAVGLALEREKRERYDSVGNFGAALRAIRTGERLPRAVAARLDE